MDFTLTDFNTFQSSQAECAQSIVSILLQTKPMCNKGFRTQLKGLCYITPYVLNTRS
jgi:hypothetical protein